MGIEKYNDFFHSHGSLSSDYPSYVVRQADADLKSCLLSKSYAYILAARQMGKSSLSIRVANEIKDLGYLSVSVDLTSLGSKNIVNAESWYYTILWIICSKVNAKVELINWWKEDIGLLPVFKFYNFISEILLPLIPEKNLVIFIDEIDSIFGIDKSKISIADFFACIRSFYNARTHKPELNRLSFVIIGVALPEELIDDPKRTPFNIGKSIQLENFTFEEAKPLCSGLVSLGCDPEELLAEILFWTGGQPILTQMLCKSLTNRNKKISNVKNDVEKCVIDIFLNVSISRNSNFSYIQTRIVEDDKNNLLLLEAYEKILKNGFLENKNLGVSKVHLKLTGLIKEIGDKLLINNNIYKSIFNLDWIESIKKLISRPFNVALKEWIESGYSNEKALLGASLNDFNIWCSSRNDLTLQEKNFQSFSNLMEIRNTEELKSIEMRTKLESEIKQRSKADDEAAKSKIKLLETKKKYFIISIILVLLMIVSSIDYYFSYKNLDKQKKNTEAKIEILKKNSDKLKKQEEDSILFYDNLRKDGILFNKRLQNLTIQYKRSNISLLKKYEHSKRIYNISLNKLKDEIESAITIKRFQANYKLLPSFDTLAVKQIFKEYSSSTDTTLKLRILKAYSKYAAFALSIKNQDSNKALWLLMEAKKMLPNSTILTDSITKLLKTSIFYSKKIIVDSTNFKGNSLNFKKLDENLIFAMSTRSLDDKDTSFNFYLIHSNSIKIEKFSINTQPINYYINHENKTINILTKNYEVYVYNYLGTLIKMFSLKNLKKGPNLFDIAFINKEANIKFWNTNSLIYIESIKDSIIYQVEISTLKIKSIIDLKKFSKEASQKIANQIKTYKGPLLMLISYNEKLNLFLFGFYYIKISLNRKDFYFNSVFVDSSGLSEDFFNSKISHDNYCGFTSDNNYIFQENLVGNRHFSIMDSKGAIENLFELNENSIFNFKNDDNTSFLFDENGFINIYNRNNQKIEMTFNGTPLFFQNGKIVGVKGFNYNFLDDYTTLYFFNYLDNNNNIEHVLSNYITPFIEEFKRDPLIEKKI